MTSAEVVYADGMYSVWDDGVVVTEKQVGMREVSAAGGAITPYIREFLWSRDSLTPAQSRMLRAMMAVVDLRDEYLGKEVGPGYSIHRLDCDLGGGRRRSLWFRRNHSYRRWNDRTRILDVWTEDPKIEVVRYERSPGEYDEEWEDYKRNVDQSEYDDDGNYIGRDWD